MREEHKSILEMWGNYLKSIGEDAESTTKSYTSWHFCNDEKGANELAVLVKDGTKRGTASLHCLYEIDKMQIPHKDDYSVITNYSGEAECIIKNKRVIVLPFKDINEELAYIEGEGDKSLEHWRKVHVDFFTKGLEEYNLKFSEDMLVVFEEFEIIYK